MKLNFRESGSLVSFCVYEESRVRENKYSKFQENKQASTKPQNKQTNTLGLEPVNNVPKEIDLLKKMAFPNN